MSILRKSLITICLKKWIDELIKLIEAIVLPKESVLLKMNENNEKR